MQNKGWVIFLRKVTGLISELSAKLLPSTRVIYTATIYSKKFGRKQCTIFIANNIQIYRPTSSNIMKFSEESMFIKWSKNFTLDMFEENQDNVTKI